MQASVMTILMKSNLKDLNDSSRLDIIMPISVLALYIQIFKLPFPKCCIVCGLYDKAISKELALDTSHCGEVFFCPFILLCLIIVIFVALRKYLQKTLPFTVPAHELWNAHVYLDAPTPHLVHVPVLFLSIA